LIDDVAFMGQPWNFRRQLEIHNCLKVSFQILVLFVNFGGWGFKSIDAAVD